MVDHDLLYYVRSIDNLYSSWSTVKANILAAGHEKFRKEVRVISDNPIAYLKNLQAQLQKEKFQFSAQRGGLKARPGKDPRPLVVSPIKNRVVQRAILNILQTEDKKLLTKLGDIPSVLRTETSIGGVPKRGVPTAIKLIKEAIEAGHTHYLRSDIQSFFVRVPKDDVINFIHNNSGDEKFSSFFRKALSTELENGEEVKEWIHLFPSNEVGVPQGSSLSALSGNIVLRDFDAQLNGRGIVTIRYIDDFVILGKSARAVKAAFSSAKKILQAIGMNAYGPDESPEKSTTGHVKEGFDFLGCTIKGANVSPSLQARNKLKDSIELVQKITQGRLHKFIREKNRRKSEEMFVQSLVLIDRKIRGWCDAFSFCNDRSSLCQMDINIDGLLKPYIGRYLREIKDADPATARRILGVSLLEDIIHSRTDG